MFIDEAKIIVKAGDGGKGCESFYRDKHMRHPRPDGGDGGHGGDVIIEASRHIQTLMDFKFKQHYQAGRGGHGSGKGKKGKDGRDCLLRVPRGTILRDAETGLTIRDLTADGASVVVARGGRGGIGNARRRHLVAPTRGEHRTVHLELKILADVGLVGFPNAGKSTLISRVSRVRSKAAAYPFTTRQPVLGIVSTEDFKDEKSVTEAPFTFAMADLPGIIEGAHKGRGLGHRFLRHAERTQVLVHVIDMAAEEGRDPWEDYQKMCHELFAYSPVLRDKTMLVVANKMDVPGARENLERFQDRYDGEVFAVSSVTRQGIPRLILALEGLLLNRREAAGTA